MLSPEPAPHTSYDALFETKRIDLHDHTPILSWEAALNDKRKPWSDEAAAPANEEAPGEVRNRPIESCCSENDDVISRGVRSAVKKLVSNKMATMVEEALNDFLRETRYSAQSGVCSVFYNVVEQVISDMLRQHVNGKT